MTPRADYRSGRTALGRQHNSTVVDGLLENAKPQQDLVVTVPAGGKQVHVARRPRDRQYDFVFND